VGVAALLSFLTGNYHLTGSRLLPKRQASDAQRGEVVQNIYE
jgi:hypothetical protein